MRTIRLASTALLLIAVHLCTPAHAAENNPNIELRYLPQQAVAPAEFNLREEVFDHAIQLRVEDARPTDKRTIIGSRTNDADQIFSLHATNEVEGFVSGVLHDVAIQHGIQLSKEAPIQLTVKLTRFFVEETNQAVGATYVAKVHFTAILTSRSGKKLWDGTATGDATRWGRKFSNANCNEVLSDALLEAYGNLLSMSELQDAWIR